MSKKQTIEIALEVYEEKKQFQEHFISKVEPKPVEEMTGNIYFGSGLFNVRVDELSDETKNTIKELVLIDMKIALINTKQRIDEFKLELGL